MAEQWNLILDFLVYLVVSLPIMGFGLMVFMLTTPYPEFKLMRGGSSGDPVKVAAAKASALDLGGKIIGLALVMASAIYHSVTVLDLVIWGLTGIAFQVIVFYAFEFLTPFSIRAEVPKGNESIAIFSSRISIAAGLIMAALIS